MLPVSWQSLDLGIQGAVSPPSIHRATRQRQYCWVNGRPVRSPLVSAALERAYGALLPPGRHPVAALGITLSPTLLDVNIHPRKTEIKFLHERAIFAGVQEAVEMVVQRLAPATLPWEEAADTAAWQAITVPALHVGEAEAPYDLRSVAPEGAAVQPLTQIGNTFIVAAGAQGLIVLDQHAAHESLLYESLMTAEPTSVELAEGFVLHLSVSQYNYVQRLQASLAALGFQLEPFGKETVLVRAVPTILHTLLRLGNLLEAFQEAMQRSTSQSSPEEEREHLAAALACRTAIRAGDPLSTAQMASLVEAVTHQRLAYACPHGRPTHVTLSLAELERRFLRLTPSPTGKGEGGKGMLDPLTAAYLAGAAANVTSNILQVLGKRWSQDLAATPRQQALERCYQAALAALVPDDGMHQALYQPLLEAFISDPAVIAELAKLVRGRTLIWRPW